MLRISAEPSNDFLLVIEELANKLKISDISKLYISDKPTSKGEIASALCGKTVEDLGIKNGSMYFVTFENENNQEVEQEITSNLASTVLINLTNIVPTKSKVDQLPVDDFLDSQDGLISRPKSYLCRHGEKGMCEYCSPLFPWDKDYKKEKGFKHLSYHAYLNEMNDQKNNKNSGTSYIVPLDEPNYNIDLNCPGGHSPYPKGICSKCQPSAITLQQQEFRMVDHVEFANHEILNKFIDSWRQSGVQRYGILYGRYEKFDEVPLGIKAVVEAIYEPPQGGEADGITLLPWENEREVDEIAKSLGLYKVGVTFTDLTDLGSNNGTVICKRHKDSYFLSCLEIIMAAKNQIKYPNVSKHSATGKFSSKFVTCVISGGLNGEIEPRSYQVSTSAEALIKADIITASTQPSMLYINQTDGKRYVPDVFYLKINEYGLEVKSDAKPAFPVDFLLVTLLDSYPINPTPMFTTNFPIENRDYIGELQDLKAAYKHIHNDTSENGAHLFDFHFLIYLYKLGILGEHEYTLLLKYVKDRKYEDYLHLVESPGWMTLITILEHSG